MDCWYICPSRKLKRLAEIEDEISELEKVEKLSGDQVKLLKELRAELASINKKKGAKRGVMMGATSVPGGSSCRMWLMTATVDETLSAAEASR